MVDQTENQRFRLPSVHWPPRPEDKAEWGSAGGIVTIVMAGASYVSPLWPLFGLLALAGFSVTVASLFRLGPWGAFPTLALGGAMLPEHIEHRLVRLKDDLPAGLSPMGHTFEDCQIVGPAHVLFGECHIENSAWIRPVLEIMPNHLTLPHGTIAFYGCRFIGCKFSSITAVGTEDEINALRAIFPPGTTR
jgi:hypothetical protein